MSQDWEDAMYLGLVQRTTQASALRAHARGSVDPGGDIPDATFWREQAEHTAREVRLALRIAEHWKAEAEALRAELDQLKAKTPSGGRPLGRQE